MAYPDAMRRPLAFLLLLVVVAGCTQAPPPTDGDLPRVDEADPDEIAILAGDRDTIWELAFAPDGRVFFTERGGTIGVIANGEAETWREMPQTVERGESGLMGLALHPDFEDEPWLYVCQTYRDGDDALRNRVARVPADDREAVPEPVVRGIDASQIHDGCRLGFGPEGLLYVTMGDAADASRAQDEGSRNGKVLAYTAEGEPAGAGEEGWHPAVFTMGHRNPQGLVFHPDTGTPYASEHGPENHDEVNRLREGANHGWPEVRGMDEGGGAYEPAVWTTGPDADENVAPAGAAFVDQPNSSLHGALLVATLKQAQLQVLEIDEADGEAEVVDEHVLFDERFGRLRAAVWEDDALYVSTSNHDGRGTPGPTDDRILRIPLPAIEDG
ncbi:glucose dehydrogenase [Thermoplasmatales archaeon SW_10_69_26]|nr:MAG: glucose dehydrogenase [Thermoplasmatales archaeon SW_10_69_26]